MPDVVNSSDKFPRGPSLSTVHPSPWTATPLTWTPNSACNVVLKQKSLKSCVSLLAINVSLLASRAVSRLVPQNAREDFTRATHKRSQSVHQMVAMYASSASAAAPLMGDKAADGKDRQLPRALAPGAGVADGEGLSMSNQIGFFWVLRCFVYRTFTVCETRAIFGA